MGPSENGFAYCESMLPKVSRTFALNIRALRGDLYRSVVIAYLWCRILDTIEDATRFPSGAKAEALAAFEGVFDGDRIDSGMLDRFVSGLAELDGEEDELEIVRNAGRVAHSYNDLPDSHRQAIRPSLFGMARGMADFQERGATPDQTVLENEADLDRYCYVVAGTVGEMLTELFLRDAPQDARRAGILRSLAVSFGLGLQTTNITKDIMVDFERGWCYVPRSMLAQDGNGRSDRSPAAAGRSLDAMIPKCMRHLRDALSYITALPRRARRIRLFCIWPVWLATRTLRMMSRPEFEFEPGVSPKITRAEVGEVVRRTSMLFWSNGWLRRDFDRMASAIELNLATRNGGAAK